MIDTLTGEEKMRELAVFMTTNPRDVNAINTFTQFLENRIGSDRLGNPLTKQWRVVVNEYARRISSLAEQDLGQDEWEQSGVALEALENAGYRVDLREYRGALDLAGLCFYRAAKYERAITCWDRCGATQRREYYLAKVEILGLPDGLEWLRKASGDSGILEAWEKAGGLASATDQPWLKYVGPSLQRAKRYRDAFQVYMRLDDTQKLLESFAQASEVLSPPDLWSDLVLLVRHLTQKSRWAEIPEVLEKYFPKIVGRDMEKASLQCEIVREIAYSELEPDSLTRKDRQRYQNLVKDVESSQGWQQRLSPKEVGAAMERIGALHVDILRFYERFVSDADSEMQRFARERWIVTKRKYEDYFKRQKQEDRAKETFAELANKARDWGMRLDNINNLPPYPLLEPRRETGAHGIPLGARVEEFPDGGFKLQVGRIEARVVRAKKRVLLTDTDSLTTLLIDLDRCEVSGQADVVLEKSESGRLSFEVPTSGYGGTAFCTGEKPRLELRVQGISETISFAL